SVMIERCGRKVLLLGSYGFMAAMMGGVTVTLSIQARTLTLAIVIEICSHSSRAAIFVIITCLNWCGLYVIGMVFPYVEAALGYYCFLIFFACLVISGVFLFFFLPETKGKTLQQITAEFDRLNFKNKKLQEPIEFSTSL
ncbi:unnamed protein product, partial [Ranitomeya imitator]